MPFAPVYTGFRTLRHTPALRGAAVPVAKMDPPRTPVREAVWSFEAGFRDADAVFLVLQEEGRASHWTELGSDDRGRWTAQIPLGPGERRATLYVQRGTTLINAGGAELRIQPPAAGAGGVRVTPAREAWSA